ncbi:MAG: hypothetical protein JO235_09710 [Chroococcidiopsidaceae cyanobacterium CP_BM_RX_35]|nr:hypothetical protein [Chroococcidiopsidaceae cyanobacterium CP_BM_RX_35]
MAKSLSDLEQVEQELAELRNQMAQSFRVLDGLVKVQTQFEDLAQTYQGFKAHLNEVQVTRKDVAQVQAAFNHRFAELEKVVVSRWEEAWSELQHTQKELGTTDHNLRAELTEQISELKGEFQASLTVFLNEWESYKQAMRAPIDELETFIKKLNNSKFSAEHFQKQTKLEAEQNLLKTQISSTQSSLRDMQRELRTMRRRLVIAVLVAGLVLPSFTVLLFAAFRH